MIEIEGIGARGEIDAQVFSFALDDFLIAPNETALLTTARWEG